MQQNKAHHCFEPHAVYSLPGFDHTSLGPIGCLAEGMGGVRHWSRAGFLTPQLPLSETGAIGGQGGPFRELFCSYPLSKRKSIGN